MASSTHAERKQLWQFALAGTTAQRESVQFTDQFRLRPEAVARAAASAQVQAKMSADGVITGTHLRAGARAENGSALEILARRVDPEVGWDDLVLPPSVLVALKEVALRARHREQVLGDWRMRPGGGRGHGVAALFAGDSGTGKTMSAEVIAHELGLDLYVVDLATVVDKYVGETEKNLERIFAAADGVNAVLLFDEADAVFGRRSEVRDAHDRYANIESAYLLQRMETFDGLAILATNLRANIDEAFTRRLDVLVDFPLPDASPSPRAVGPQPRPPGRARVGREPHVLRRRVRARRRGDPLRRRHRRLPRGRGGWRGDDAAPGDSGAAGVPQARPAVPGERVRALLAAACLKGQTSLPEAIGPSPCRPVAAR